MADEVQEVLHSVSSKALDKNKDPKHLSLESLTVLINANRLHELEKNSRKELSELRERHQKVAFLHKFLKTINAMTSPTHEFDWTNTPELGEMVLKAKEMGVELDERKFKYGKEERERLLENIRMTVEDLNTLNELQLQTITRLTNERYESYQMARNIAKPEHDAKLSPSRNIHPRG